MRGTETMLYSYQQKQHVLFSNCALLQHETDFNEEYRPKKSDDRHVQRIRHNTVDARTFPRVLAATPIAF